LQDQQKISKYLHTDLDLQSWWFLGEILRRVRRSGGLSNWSVL